MRIAHLLVCHSVDPAPLLRSVPEVDGAAWAVAFHGTDSDLCKHVLGLLADRSDVTFVAHMKNRGLARSWNDAIDQHAYADGYFLLNDDVRFHDCAYTSFLEFARGHIARRDVGLITLKGLEIGTSWIAGQITHQSFSCGILTRAAIDTIGYFDEYFRPAYFEDCDYQRRMNLAGLHCISDDRVLVEHNRLSTKRHMTEDEVANLNAAWHRSREYYLAKWGGLNDQEVFIRPFDDPSRSLKIDFEQRGVRGRFDAV